MKKILLTEVFKIKEAVMDISAVKAKYPEALGAFLASLQDLPPNESDPNLWEFYEDSGKLKATTKRKGAGAGTVDQQWYPDSGEWDAEELDD